MMNMIRCTACGYQIPVAVFASSREGACPLCRRRVQAASITAVIKAIHLHWREWPVAAMGCCFQCRPTRLRIIAGR